MCKTDKLNAKYIFARVTYVIIMYTVQTNNAITIKLDNG